METMTPAVRLFQELSATTSQFAVSVARRVNVSLMRPQSVCMYAVLGGPSHYAVC